jgi:hypothetical protein
MYDFGHRPAAGGGHGGSGRLQNDLATGASALRHADLLASDEIDAGYCIVVAGAKA